MAIKAIVHNHVARFLPHLSFVFENYTFSNLDRFTRKCARVALWHAFFASHSRPRHSISTSISALFESEGFAEHSSSLVPFYTLWTLAMAPKARSERYSVSCRRSGSDCDTISFLTNKRSPCSAMVMSESLLSNTKRSRSSIPELDTLSCGFRARRSCSV